MNYRERSLDEAMIPAGDVCLAYFKTANQYSTQYVDWYKKSLFGGDCIYDPDINLMGVVIRRHQHTEQTLSELLVALRKAKAECYHQNITKIVFVVLKRSIADLKWKDVSEMIQRVFKDTDITITALVDETYLRDV